MASHIVIAIHTLVKTLCDFLVVVVEGRVFRFGISHGNFDFGFECPETPLPFTPGLELIFENYMFGFEDLKTLSLPPKMKTSHSVFLSCLHIDT